MTVLFKNSACPRNKVADTFVGMTPCQHRFAVNHAVTGNAGHFQVAYLVVFLVAVFMMHNISALERKAGLKDDKTVLVDASASWQQRMPWGNIDHYVAGINCKTATFPVVIALTPGCSYFHVVTAKERLAPFPAWSQFSAASASAQAWREGPLAWVVTMNKFHRVSHEIPARGVRSFSEWRIATASAHAKPGRIELLAIIRRDHSFPRHADKYISETAVETAKEGA